MIHEKRVIVVGIPGVGKTTVIERVTQLSTQRKIQARHVVFGTVMMQEAERLGVKDRDQIRKRSLQEQKELQSLAAERIGKLRAQLLIIDTHLFIKTQEGYLPGMPLDVLKTVAPTNIVLVDAPTPNIIARRAKDLTRRRDVAADEEVEMDRRVALAMISATGVALGVPFSVVENREGEAETTAMEVLGLLGVS